MERIPEPEIMSAEDEAKVYALADFSDVNQAFADRLFELIPDSHGMLIDLGCGPGDILIRIGEATPRLQLIGLDGAEAMLQLAEKMVNTKGRQESIFLIQGDAKLLGFPDHSFDVVISNSLVHHLPDPLPFWKELRRVVKSGGTILIQDLARPRSEDEAWEIVERESGDEPQLLKDLFFYSLRASFTVEEIQKYLLAAGLERLSVRMSSDRHWEVAGRV